MPRRRGEVGAEVVCLVEGRPKDQDRHVEVGAGTRCELSCSGCSGSDSQVDAFHCNVLGAGRKKRLDPAWGVLRVYCGTGVLPALRT